ncbi:MAG: Fe-S protein assembly co-chaperone HscB [Proteobacteria bacterium]|nr:Fe-S protein assembly co-chaperone HscB [Pseudomonadota bacterium]
MTQPEFRRAAPRGGQEVDFYALLGLAERYEIDRAELESRYLEKSKNVHPDRFVAAPAAERVAALQRSMQLNQAYKTLKRPLARAEYLLARRGTSIGANETLEPGFLMEVLELREELATAKQAGDAAKLRQLESAMRHREEDTLGRIAALFGTLEESGDSSVLTDIKREVILMRYIERYLDEFQDDI